MSDIRAGACISLAITVVLLLWATTNAGEKAVPEIDRAADALFAEGVVPRLQIQLSAGRGRVAATAAPVVDNRHARGERLPRA